ncbi:MAG: hypothetical protein M3R63_04965 [Actinomycetota bacterium]|nr:hypothetical protein [Actinomycetota bacterium]
MNAPRVPRRGRFAVAATAAALALALSGCAGAAPTGAAPAAPPGSASGTTAASGALEFAASTVDGGRFDASTLTGSPVVLWFWAPF